MIQQRCRDVLLIGLIVVGAVLAAFDNRPAYHFLPQNGMWMNDPNGLMEYLGVYHLFFQYDPTSSLGTGPKLWGHAVSKDLVHWDELAPALYPNNTYDIGGVWSGSASFQQNGNPVLIFTGVLQNWQLAQVQCAATPVSLVNLSLPLWSTYSSNPIFGPPAPLMAQLAGFRDPTTALHNPIAPNSSLILVGSGFVGKGGAVLMFVSDDPELFHWKYVGPLLVSTPFPGQMWECPDFYFVPQTEANTDNQVAVLKVSVDQLFYDAYAIGSFSWTNLSFVPQQVGRVDWGNTYASKSFFDSQANRRVLFGWVKESDSNAACESRGWSGVQTLPREVTVGDNGSLAFTPAKELQQLRQSSPYVQKKFAVGNSSQHLPVSGTQLEVLLTFEFSSNQSSLFFTLLASDDGSENTTVQFRASDRSLIVDRSWSSQSSTPDKSPQSAPIADENTQSVHLFVDHSVIEIYANHYTSVVTSRVYPTLNQSTGVYLRAEGEVLVQHMEVYQLEL